MKNLIDWIQDTWLGCCGVESFRDWEENEYFNCKSPSREACGVPFSCCKRNSTLKVINKQCGYDLRKKMHLPNYTQNIYTIGCLQKGSAWISENLIPILIIAISLCGVQVNKIILRKMY